MLSEPFQTIIYEPRTGEIVSIRPGQYISSRKKLDRLVPGHKPGALRFMYLKNIIPIKKEDFKVVIQDPKTPPKLQTNDEKDSTLTFFRYQAEMILAGYRQIELCYEGGMGDYMDQADVTAQLIHDYPDNKFFLIARQDRMNAIRFMKGMEGATVIEDTARTRSRRARIKFSGINDMGGHYPEGGKVGVYSAIAGYKETVKRRKIKVPEAVMADVISRLRSLGISSKETLIAVHTISGKNNAKTLNTRKAKSILERIGQRHEARFLQVGGAGEESIEGESIINLQGTLNWQEVFGVLSLCRGCLCIDSAIMHIAQHLNIPTLALWGPTTPLNILDRDSGVNHITPRVECAGCGRYECEDNLCLLTIDTEEVAGKAKELFFTEGEKECLNTKISKSTTTETTGTHPASNPATPE